MTLIFFIFVFGLFLGSFLGVLVERIPKDKTVMKGRSRCDKCKKELGWYDLVPVLSFVFLKSRCRYCGTKLSFFYPIIEVSTGILFMLTYIFVISNFSSQGGSAFGGQFFPTNFIRAGSTMETTIGTIFNFQFLYYLFMISTFIVIFFTDLKYGIIPDKIVFPAIVVSIFYLLIFNPSSLILNLISGVGAFLFFLIIPYAFFVLTKKQGMGGGDIKLSLLLGLFLGFPNVLIALYLAFLTGAFVTIILILWEKKRFLKDSLPFGPFLIFGALIGFFFGDFLYPVALNLFGL